jgi:hypothetical protein
MGNDARSAEARDPSTPLPRLLELLEDRLEDVLINPAFSLLMLERPTLWDRIPSEVWKPLARSPRCPVLFAHWVLAQPTTYVPVELSTNRELPASLRRQALLRLEPLDYGHLRENPLQVDAFTELLTPAEATVLTKADTPGAALAPSDFDMLRSLGLLGQRMARRHDACPTALLEQLWVDGSNRDQAEMLAHPNVPRRRLEAILAGDPHGRRHHALLNPTLTDAQLEANARSPGDRGVAARNKGLSAAWFERLAHDPEASVRCQLASNPALPDRLLRALALDSDDEVKWTAQNWLDALRRAPE